MPGDLLMILIPDAWSLDPIFRNDPTHVLTYIHYSLRDLLMTSCVTELLDMPNYRCYSAHLLRDVDFNLFGSPYLTPLACTIRIPVLEFNNRKSASFFAFASR